VVVTFGPIVKFIDPDVPLGNPASFTNPLGSESFEEVGFRADVDVDQTVMGPKQQSGFRLIAGAAGYPAAWDASDPFAEAHAEGRLFIPLKWPTIALRAGGQKVWGNFPLQESAFIGGRKTLRGFAWNRFAGDASAYGSAELHLPIARIALLTRGELGAIGFTDAGRVWFEGESADGWHTSAGGGLWFSSLGQTVSVFYGKGEEGKLYFSFGHPF
jgi:hypothetical protein